MNTLAELLAVTRRLPRASSFTDPQATTADDVAQDMIEAREPEGREAALAHLCRMSPEDQAAELVSVSDPVPALAELIVHPGHLGAVFDKLRESYVEDHWQDHAEQIALRDVRGEREAA